MTINITSLFSVQTAAEILETGLELAAAAGLPVSTWRAGDPTRSLYKFLAEVLASQDSVSAEFVKSAFLSSATGDWLKVLASEVYGVTAVEATYATPTITLTNNGGGHFEIQTTGYLTVRNSVTQKTYHNTSLHTLDPGDTITVDLVADEAGSDSSVGTNEIDELVTTLLGVDIDSSTVALANDDESEESIRQRCQDSLGALSPNGPADAYRSVALNPDLTGNTSVNRAEAVGSTTGAVTITIASASGPADGAAITAVQDAIERWSTPLCCSPTVVSASTLSVDRDITIFAHATLTASLASITSTIESVFTELFANTPIGGNQIGGEISTDTQTKAIRDAFPNQIYKIEGCDAITLAEDEVPVLGTLNVVRQ